MCGRLNTCNFACAPKVLLVKPVANAKHHPSNEQVATRCSLPAAVVFGALCFACWRNSVFAEQPRNISANNGRVKITNMVISSINYEISVIDVYKWC